MAAYREHITVSFALGAGVACGAVLGLNYTPIQGILAGCLTGIGGMLPDLDSQSGKPVREIFGLTAALAPMLLMQRLLEWGQGTDGAIFLAVVMYVIIRYGASKALGKFAVHRGMFHSVPAMLIAAELAFLGYKSESIRVRALMGVGVAIGFLSHLVLDEIYAVEWTGTRIKLNKFAGSAVKFFGHSWGANIFTYAILAFFTYALTIEDDILRQPLNRVHRALAAPLRQIPIEQTPIEQQTSAPPAEAARPVEAGRPVDAIPQAERFQDSDQAPRAERFERQDLRRRN